MVYMNNYDIQHNDGFYELYIDGMLVVGFPARWQLIEWMKEQGC